MCGLVGLRNLGDKKSATELALHMLMRLQHRGQDGAGLTVLSPTGQFETARGLGLIQTALKDWQDLPASPVAVAHTRYATTGTGGVGEIQPFVRGLPRVALAHNGNIVNTAALIEKFQLKVETNSDLDVLQQVFLLKSAEGGFQKAVQTIFDEFNGSYAVVGIEEDGTLFGFRDPFGIRPLFLAQSEQTIAMASETCALTPLSPQSIVEINPGEWVRVSSAGKVERGHLMSKMNRKNQERFCMFEVVYFSSPQSEVRQQSIYRLRFKLGQKLAQEILDTLSEDSSPKEHFDYVVPVPETSRTAAIAVAEALVIPYREYLVKNAYVPRTFILGKQTERIEALQAKLSLIGPEIRGQRILLVDDSVVRGNTSRLMAMRLREAGARSVTLASTCPPIRFGCYYGIDFPDPTELVATGRQVPEIAKALSVDGLFYLSQKGLQEALDTENLCMACLDGKYPTQGPAFERFLEDRRNQRSL